LQRGDEAANAGADDRNPPRAHSGPSIVQRPLISRHSCVNMY
jgi:hypothetical protein